MKNPKVSVLMSVYNGEKYLRAAIDSILNQIFSDFEFLIINDGSTDSSRDIIHSYNDPRIRLINNKKNIGITKSLNKGIKLAKGEYIARQDADDISTLDRLEKELGFLNNHKNYAAVGSFAKIINEKTKNTILAYKPVTNDEIKDFFWIGTPFIHGSVLIKKDYLQRVGLYDESMIRSQDYDLWLRLSDRFSLANIPEFLYTRNLHQNAIETRYRSDQLYYVQKAKEKALETKINHLLEKIEKKDNQFKKELEILVDLIIINKIAKLYKRTHQVSYRLNFSTFKKIMRPIPVIIMERIKTYNKIDKIITNLTKKELSNISAKTQLMEIIKGLF